MGDLETVLEAPFESASNRSFELLLLIGCGLLVAVAVVGRSTVMMGVVGGYLCLIPGYIAYRNWVWSRDDESTTEN